MKYKEIEIDGEKIYLKKSKIFGNELDWKIIHPYKIDGKINWKNLLIGGSWIGFFKIVFIILLILGCVYEYSTAVQMANDCLEKYSMFKVNF